MSNEQLTDFVYRSVFQYQTKRIDDIFRRARKRGFSTTRKEVSQLVEAVCTPYKRRR